MNDILNVCSESLFPSDQVVFLGYGKHVEIRINAFDHLILGEDWVNDLSDGFQEKFLKKRDKQNGDQI